MPMFHAVTAPTESGEHGDPSRWCPGATCTLTVRIPLLICGDEIIVLISCVIETLDDKGRFGTLRFAISFNSNSRIAALGSCADSPGSSRHEGPIRRIQCLLLTQRNGTVSSINALEAEHDARTSTKHQQRDTSMRQNDMVAGPNVRIEWQPRKSSSTGTRPC